MRAVIFDVDGTLVDSERYGHRVAFNLAFEAFELPHRWDEEEYGRLLRTTGGQRRIAGYLVAQGMDEGGAGALATELHKRKTAILTGLIDEGRIEARPGVGRLLAELAGVGCALAVATTGSRSWVERILSRTFSDVDFSVVVTGDEVVNRKPHPEAYVTALERLGMSASEAVAVEDSAEGLEAARGAGLACAVVANGYTIDHDLSAAQLVLDGFGQPDRPARVIVDRVGTGCRGVLDEPTLSNLGVTAR